MNFGGQYELGGNAYLGGEPYGFSPGYVCARLISALSRFEFKNNAGSVKTIKRIEEDFDVRDPKAIDKHVTAGLPAFLIAYGGGTFKPRSTSGRRFEQTVTFTIICIASSFQDVTARLAGRNSYEPGLDNLLRWATHYGGRELLRHDTLNNARPTAHRYLSFGGGRYIGAADFEAETWSDLYEDALDITLQRMGVVHSPVNVNQLFDADNTTPNSTEPADFDGGVFELKN